MSKDQTHCQLPKGYEAVNQEDMIRLPKLGKWAFGLAIFCVLAGTFIYLTRDFWFEQIRAYALGSIRIEAEKTTLFLPDVDEIEVVLLGNEKDTTNYDVGNQLPYAQANIWNPNINLGAATFIGFTASNTFR